MFLVPKNIYMSMLSRIHEDDTKEEIKLINRQKDDGNYIEKAINFNNQQELQKNQKYVNPNVTNETIGTNTYYSNAPNISSRNQSNANMDTTYLTVLDPNTRSIASTSTQGQLSNAQSINQNQSNDNMGISDASMMDQSMASMGAVASTPIRRQRSVSILPPFVNSTETNLAKINEEGDFICNFCKRKFSDQDVLVEHLEKVHEVDMSSPEYSSVMYETANKSTLIAPPITNTSAFENTGATPKRKSVRISDPPVANTATFENTEIIPEGYKAVESSYVQFPPSGKTKRKRKKNSPKRKKKLDIQLKKLKIVAILKKFQKDINQQNLVMFNFHLLE